MNTRILDKNGKLIGFRGVCKCGQVFEDGRYSARRELCDDCRRDHRKIAWQKYHKKNPKRKTVSKTKKKSTGKCYCCGINPIMPGGLRLCFECYTGNGDETDYHNVSQFSTSRMGAAV